VRDVLEIRLIRCNVLCAFSFFICTEFSLMFAEFVCLCLHDVQAFGVGGWLLRTRILPSGI
jgi:hypothetical protein